MKIKIIQLAAKKIKLRKITSNMLNETVTSPDQTVKGYGGRTIKQKQRKNNFSWALEPMVPKPL